MIRDLKFICLSNFFGAFGDGLYFYILPNYIRALEATPAEVGVTFAVLSLASAITPIPGGLLADKYDRKKIMIIGWSIWIPVPLMFSLASHWAFLIPSMFLYGFFISGPASSAYVATAVEKNKMARAFTTLAASWWVGYIFSPALGGYVSELMNMNWVFYFSFIFYSLAMGTLFLINSQYASMTSTVPVARDASRVRRVLLWSLFLAVVVFLLTMVRPLIPQLFQDVYRLDSFYIGTLGSITFLGATFWCLYLGRLGDEWRKSGAIFIALIISSISMGVLVLSEDFLILCLCSFFIGASYTIWSLTGAIIGPMAPEATRGRWISISLTGATIASLTASLVGGVLYQIWPYGPFIIVVCGATILAVLGFVWWLKK